MDTLSHLLKHRGADIGLILVLFFVVLAIFGPWIAPQDPYDQLLTARLNPPDASHWFGTDGYGRDILSRIIHGAHISLMIGAFSVVLGLGFGFILGLVAGYERGVVDEIIMRAMDIMIAFPGILLAIVVIAVLGPGLYNVVFAVGIWSIPIFARLIRSSVLEIREQEFILASQAIGCSDLRIMLRHIVPNCIGPLLVLGTLRFATSILSAAGLSFLGLGAQPPTPDWGAMLSDGQKYLAVAWWVATFPGIAIMLIVLAFNLIGDGLRDVLDPRMRKGKT
ncbi:ABC transporter permease [archaeon]|nr:MAG: ABC transporter permease [archaeon]